MAASGATDDEIAAVVGRTRTAIWQLRERRGIRSGNPRQKFSDCDVIRVRRLAAYGWTDRKIAEAMGTLRDRIYELRSRYGIKAGIPAKRNAP